MITCIEKLAHICWAELQRCQCGSLQEIVRKLRCIKRLNLANCLETKHIFIVYIDKLLRIKCIRCRRNDRHDTNHFALLILAVIFRNPAVRIKRYISYYKRVVSDSCLTCAELVNC